VITAPRFQRGLVLTERAYHKTDQAGDAAEFQLVCSLKVQLGVLPSPLSV